MKLTSRSVVATSLVAGAALVTVTLFGRSTDRADDAPDAPSSGFAAWQGLPAPEELPGDPAQNHGGPAWGGLAADWANAARARCQAAYPGDCYDYAIALQQQQPPELRALAAELHAAVCSTRPASASCTEWARAVDARGDTARAIEIARAACKHQAPDGCVVLALLEEPPPAQEGSSGAPPPPSEASPDPNAGIQERYLAEQHQRCATGDATACNNADALAMQGADAAARELAAARMRQRCDDGNSDACMVLTGLGATDDPETLRELLEQACTLGRRDACAQLDALDAPPPPERTPDELAAAAQAEQLARQLALYDDYAARCAEGDQRACSTVAYLDFQGLGRRNEPQDAVSALEAACERGDGWGCQLAGSIRLRALEDEPSDDVTEQQVAALLRRGCDLGDGDACRQLSESGLAEVVADSVR